MPCTSDYPEPSELQRRNQEAARMLIYVHKRLGKKSLPRLVDAAKDVYCNVNSAKPLCAILNEMTHKVREAFIYGDPHDRKARELATWWENHERADKERSRIAKLKGAAVDAAAKPEVRAFIKWMRTAKLNRFDWEVIERRINAAAEKYIDQR